MADAYDPKPGDRFTIVVPDIPINFGLGVIREYTGRFEVTVVEVRDDDEVRIRVDRVRGVPRSDSKQIAKRVEGWCDLDAFANAVIGQEPRSALEGP